MTTTLQFLDGETRLIGVMGDPVKQVRSPHAVTTGLQAQGLNAINVPLHVRPEDFPAVVEALKRVPNFVGSLLTVPHKFAGVEVVDRISDRARVAGAINALRRERDGSWAGDNFDGLGFVNGLVHDGHDPKGRSVFIAGAGGAGCAVAAALAVHGAAHLRLFDLSKDRLSALYHRLSRHFPQVTVEPLHQADPAGVDIAVNATPLGLRPDDPLAFEIGRLRPGAVVAEVVMKPPVTRLLEEARAAGHSVTLGENVMNFQLSRCVAFFADAC